MNIYCKNYKCPFNKKLDEPINFKFSQVYTPFEGDKCNGKCSIHPYFSWFDDIKGDFRYEGSECSSWTANKEDPEYVGEDNALYCTQSSCSYNDGDKHGNHCSRKEILVEKATDGNTYLYGGTICKCYSLSKIRGHMDWFGRFLNNDGTAKGGHIDDNYAQKINKWQKTTRSYRTHIKQVP